MSIHALISAQPYDPPLLDKLESKADFADVVGAAYDRQVDTLNADSRTNLIRNEKREAYSEYERLVGELPAGRVTQRGRRSRIDDETYDLRVRELREKDPSKYDTLKTSDEIINAAVQKAQASEQSFNEVSGRSSGLSAFTGAVVGSMAGAFTDPLNIAATVVTAPIAGVTTGARAAGTTFLSNLFSKQTLQVAGREALINAGTEAVNFSAVAEWQKEIGLEYGLGDLLENMATGALFGAGATFAFRGAQLTKDIAYSKLSEAPLSDDAKAAAQALSRSEDLSNAIPFDQPTPQQRNMHADLVQKGEIAFLEGRPLTLKDLEKIPLPDDLPNFDLTDYNIDLGLTDYILRDVKEGVPKPRAKNLPKRLTQFIVDNGGIVDRGLSDFERSVGADTIRTSQIKEAGGEVLSIVGTPTARPGLINNKTGKSFDEMGDVAFQAGYFPNRPDRQEFFDALDRDFNYGEVYPEGDKLERNLIDYRERKGAVDSVTEMLFRADIDYQNLSNEQIREAVRLLKDSDDLSEAMGQLAREGYLGRPLAETFLPDDVERQLLELDIIKQDPLPIADATLLFQDAQKQPALDAVNADFDRLTEAQKNLELTLEDQEITINNLLKEFEEEDNLLFQINTCGLG